MRDVLFFLILTRNRATTALPFMPSPASSEVILGGSKRDAQRTAYPRWLPGYVALILLTSPSHGPSPLPFATTDLYPEVQGGNAPLMC